MIGGRPIDVRSDWHTHSDLTDGTASAGAMADAAVEARLTSWGLSDHVRADSGWLADYAVATRAIRRPGLEIRCGVEAKLLDRSGRLDLPKALPNLDYVLIADHQFPGPTGPQHPADVRAAIENGSLSAADAVDELVLATALGVCRSPFPPIIAHLFSLLPKVGLSEDDVTADHLDRLVGACLAADAAVEVNQKWRCPSARSVAYFASAGVAVTAGSDAHRMEDVGRHSYLDSVFADIAMAAGNHHLEPNDPLLSRAP